MRKLFSSKKANRNKQKASARTKRNAGIRFVSKDNDVNENSDMIESSGLIENNDMIESSDVVNNNGINEYIGTDEYNDMDENSDMGYDDKWSKSNKRSTRNSERNKIIYISLMIVGVVLATAALRIILSDANEDAAARSEYEQIRERFPEVSGPVNNSSNDINEPI